MKILMVSAEAVPFAKTGGLADAVSALSAELAKLGHDVRVVIPRYYAIDRGSLEVVRKSVLVGVGWQEVGVDFYTALLP
ncbi:MAG: glycogen/starch synthase, partial [Treponemataceae bacterium]|nr:glycogen/starch synthase [Treponemataceae bacterium]